MWMPKSRPQYNSSFCILQGLTMVLSRVEFRKLCLSIMRSRIDRAYISSHASRLLRLAICTYAADDDEVRATVEAILLNVPHRRVTVAAITGFLRQHLNMPITQHNMDAAASIHGRFTER